MCIFVSLTRVSYTTPECLQATVAAIYIGAAKSIGAALFAAILGHSKKTFLTFLLEKYASEC
jgi:hypothetical protein